MKKKIIITVLVIVSIVALIFTGFVIDLFQPASHGIPIDKITGIYSSANLKQGCTVISANDLMKADLHYNYTLRGAPSKHMPRILIILIPVVILVVFAALHIRFLKKKYQRERYEE